MAIRRMTAATKKGQPAKSTTGVQANLHQRDGSMLASGRGGERCDHRDKNHRQRQCPADPEPPVYAPLGFRHVPAAKFFGSSTMPH